MNISISDDLEKSIKNLIEQGKFSNPEQVIEKSIEIGIKILRQQESTDINETCQKNLKINHFA